MTPDWIQARKIDELALADAILCCSPFAAATYVNAGVSPDRVHAVPLGTDFPIGAFAAVSKPERPSFVFAGAFRRVKGADLILEVFEQFANAGSPARLTVIGGLPEADLAARLQALPNAEHLPFIPKPPLFDELARHHCLLLPSRFDAFGMVVPEAMTVGVPALVSERVGAKCILEAHPGAGWVIPPTADALRDQLLHLIREPQALLAASHAARRAAQDYGWPSYRARVAKLIPYIYAQFRRRVHPADLACGPP